MRSLRLGRVVSHPTNLQSADLTGATLTWATLDGADLRMATVTEEQLRTLGSDKNLKRSPWRCTGSPASGPRPTGR
jgi:uncharacterized protein YjbI with pentapeptide repeats